MGTLEYQNPRLDDDGRIARRQALHRRIAVWLLVLVAVIVVVIWSLPVLDGPGSWETRRRVKCSSNLKWIGQALLLYQNENNAIPTEITALLASGDVPSDALCCPSRLSTPAQGATTQAVMTDLVAGGHLDYIWAAAGIVGQPTVNDVIAFDAFDHTKWDDLAKPEGMMVLFGDGHTEFVDPKQARQIRDQFNAGVRPVRWPTPAAAATAPAANP